ncbi:polyprenyl synthetase family protein [Chloroflexota bacterium]
MELDQIYESIQEDLGKVKDKLLSISNIDFPWLSEQLHYVVKSGGKGIRPALTLLAGKFYNYDLTYLLPMAISVELMHTSTLVHDDTIDKALVRRGQSTINRLWGDDIAILLGDYLFAKAGESVADTRNPQVIKLFSHTLAIISSGEINQFLSAFNLEQSRGNYLQRITSKTASLFALSTKSGAILSQAPEKSIEVLENYGYNLGIAFQIVDDILDFISDEKTLGKPAGSDLIQGTLTLPAMMLLERYPEDNPIKSFFENRGKQNITKAIEIVRNSPIVEDCYRTASKYCAKACENLSLLPDNPAHQTLKELADFVIKRKD